MRRAFSSLCIVLFAGLLLAGCASTRLVDSDVTAFSAWPAAPAAPGTPYKFERLPSQQAAGPQQDRLEALAQGALAKVGLVLAPATPRLSVQVVVNSQVVQRFADDDLLWGGPGMFPGPLGYGYGYGGWGGYGAYGNYGGPAGFPFAPRFGELYYKRDVSVQMRDLATGQVVFETRALHDGPWRDTYSVLPAMLDAALFGFPQPPAGTRRVDVQIPR